MRQKSHSDSGLGQHHFSTLDTDMEQKIQLKLQTLIDAQQVLKELLEDQKRLTSFLYDYDLERYIDEDKNRRMLRDRAIEAMVMLKYIFPQYIIEETK